jgi:ribosomal protein S18 acetylase RimI-like enzyme
MISAGTDVIGWGGERARAGPWQGDRRVAYLMPLPTGPTPSVGFVRWALDELAGRGFSRVVTNALPAAEQGAFLGAGFEVHEQLHLLGHDLCHIPPARPVEHRRARAPDRAAVLDVDGRAFPVFWRLDERGLGEALAATPRTRFRVAPHGGAVVAYALTGRAGRRGFVQRLAVHPQHRRQGLARALVVDALLWLRRRRAARAVVNTPARNVAALALYESLGFRREPSGLCVLAAALEADAGPQDRA